MNAGEPNIIEGQISSDELIKARERGEVIWEQLHEDILKAAVCKDRSEKNCGFCNRSAECPITIRRELG